MSDITNGKSALPSRRRVLALVGAASFVPLPWHACAQGTDTLRIGFISPRTGPLGQGVDQRQDRPHAHHVDA